jgi:hypothetical protein
VSCRPALHAPAKHSQISIYLTVFYAFFIMAQELQSHRQIEQALVNVSLREDGRSLLKVVTGLPLSRE